MGPTVRSCLGMPTQGTISKLQGLGSSYRIGVVLLLLENDEEHKDLDVV